MKKRLLEIIVCPYCKDKFSCKSFSERKTGFSGKYSVDIVEGLLTSKCGRWYPIVRSVPRVISDSLRPKIFPGFGDFFRKYGSQIPKSNAGVTEKISADEQFKTISGFGYEWTKFSKMHGEYELQFLDWMYPLQPSFFKGKLVMDAGCGTGRHSMISAKFGAEIVGVDLSESVEVAAKVTESIEKAHIIQTDIYKLPFKEGTFDFVYSIGVIHHLPNPQEGFRSIVSVTRKKGLVYAWVYGREGNILLKIMDPIRKHVISKLPHFIINVISLMIMLIVHPIIKLVYGPLNRNSQTRNFAQRVLPQNAFFYYMSKFNFNINHSILFDQLVAPIANYYTKEEFKKWFTDENLKDISLTWRNKNSWRGFGVRP